MQKVVTGLKIATNPLSAMRIMLFRFFLNANQLFDILIKLAIVKNYKKH
jgi:hypothetical protein